MSVVIIDGRVRVSWLTACANILLPTTTELNAGTGLEGFITPDGLDIAITTGSVDTSNLGSTFTTMRAGRKKPAITLTFLHDSPTDTPFNLMVYRASGFLACRYGIDKATAWTTGDKVKVYPVEVAEPSETKPGVDATWGFSVDLFVTADPATRAVVA